MKGSNRGLLTYFTYIGIFRCVQGSFGPNALDFSVGGRSARGVLAPLHTPVIWRHGIAFTVEGRSVKSSNRSLLCSIFARESLGGSRAVFVSIY